MKIIWVLILLLFLFFGCGIQDEKEYIDNDEKKIVIDPTEYNGDNESEDLAEEGSREENADYSEQNIKNKENETAVEETEKSEPEELEILNFVDVFGEEYQVPVDPGVLKHEYSDQCFIHDGYKLSYSDDAFSSRLGVDVSHHQGYIDWEKVKNDGYDFCFLRIGFRGYGKEGAVKADREFERNAANARKAGLDVGVYFFSQAVNEEEAEEEADFVIGLLNDRELQLPVVYDPESILDDEARTDDVTEEQFTENAVVFCSRIKEAGYDPAIYSNMLWEAYELDLKKLEGIPIWYADYEKYPQTPYNFRYWQYYNEAKVDGINGVCDTDIELIPWATE